MKPNNGLPMWIFSKQYFKIFFKIQRNLLYATILLHSTMLNLFFFKKKMVNKLLQGLFSGKMESPLLAPSSPKTLLSGPFHDLWFRVHGHKHSSIASIVDFRTTQASEQHHSLLVSIVSRTSSNFENVQDHNVRGESAVQP